MAEQSKFQGSVHIKVKENVTLDNLTQLLARVGGLAGCQHCGLLGIDLRLSGDPVESQALGSLPGVKSVTFGQ